MKIKYLIIIALSIIYAQVDDNYFEEIITPIDPPQMGMFGSRMTISEDDIIIYGNSSIYCFHNNNNQWDEQQLINESEACNFAVSIDSNDQFLVVGAPSLSSYCPENNFGEVYVYQKTNGLWVNDTVLSVTDESVFDFGMTVSLEEDLLTIVARKGNSSIFDVWIYLYRYDGESWLQQDVIMNIESTVSFGNNLLIHDGKLFISDAAYNNYSGIVYIFESSPDGWLLTDSITAQVPLEYSSFGSSLCYEGSNLFIGAFGHTFMSDLPGFVYVFQQTGDNWNELQIITASDAESKDRFGESTSCWGNYLAIGAINNDDAGQGSGSAYIFQEINGNWNEVKKIIPSDASNGNFFGVSVEMDQDFVFIGAHYYNNLEGAVYVYDPHDTTLHANFAGDVRNGNAPVTVQFTAVPQGNPTAYEWDFNSDGFVDSTEPNPEFTYQINGTYTVTLTVYDETGSDSEVKEDYIQVVSDILFGDVDQSGELDVGDLVLYIAFVLGDAEPTENQFIAGDVNYSGQIDIIDIVMVIHQILGD